MSDMSDDDMDIEGQLSILENIISTIDDPSVPSRTPSTSTDSDDVQHNPPSSACIICQCPQTTRKCGLCNDALICSVACQEVAVCDDIDSTHFATCVSKAETSMVMRTAKTLYKNVLGNRIPSDQHTLNDYQFHWFHTHVDRRNLLKVYANIFGMFDVTPLELDVWVREKKLLARISMLFHASPKLTSLADLTFIRGSALWTDGLSKTERDIFQEIIYKQEKIQWGP